MPAVKGVQATADAEVAAAAQEAVGARAVGAGVRALIAIAIVGMIKKLKDQGDDEEAIRTGQLTLARNQLIVLNVARANTRTRGVGEGGGGEDTKRHG